MNIFIRRVYLELNRNPILVQKKELIPVWFALVDNKINFISDVYQFIPPIINCWVRN